MSQLRLKIRRQARADDPSTATWETFAVEAAEAATIMDALAATQRRPVTIDGATTTPVAFEGGCDDGGCGACAMLIDGRARLACRTRVDAEARGERPLVVEPLGKFPVVRDLVVDRHRLAEDLDRSRAWVRTDGTEATGDGRAPTPDALAATLSQCLNCALCLEACPQYGPGRDFIGAAPLVQIHARNAHPVGAHDAAERLEAAMGSGGIAECGKAQVCVNVCPVGLPLTDGLQHVAGATSWRLLTRWLRG